MFGRSSLVQTLSRENDLDQWEINIPYHDRGGDEASLTTGRLAKLVEYRTTVREVVGSNPGRTTTQGL